MPTRNTPRGRGLRLAVVACVVLAALVLAACGSAGGASTGGTGQGSAQSLLRQTFSGSHKIRSGVLSFSLSATPSGSTTFTTPLGLQISGPFQSRSAGKAPASDFSIVLSGLGQTGKLGLISTGAAGYLTLDGAAYQLPAADFARLESGFSGRATGGAGVAALGIDPMTWLKGPTVVGSQEIGGAATTHIRAGVNVPALLASVDRLLTRAAHGAGSTSIPTSIPPATRQKIAAAIKGATIDIWTGSRDRTLRRLEVGLTVPVGGHTATALGGMTSAAIRLSLQYAHLNEPQTISAPANVQPYSGFEAKLQSIVGGLMGGLGSAGALGGGSTANVTRYGQCVQRARGDVSKLQKCASLLNGS